MLSGFVDEKTFFSITIFFIKQQHVKWNTIVVFRALLIGSTWFSSSKDSNTLNGRHIMSVQGVFFCFLCWPFSIFNLFVSLSRNKSNLNFVSSRMKIRWQKLFPTTRWWVFVFIFTTAETNLTNTHIHTHNWLVTILICMDHLQLRINRKSYSRCYVIIIIVHVSIIIIMTFIVVIYCRTNKQTMEQRLRLPNLAKFRFIYVLSFVVVVCGPILVVVIFGQ